MESPDGGGCQDEAQLLGRVQASAHAVARRMVRSRDRAKDIAQDVAAECLSRLRSGTWDVAPERLEAYVATMVRRRRNELRVHRRQAAARDWTYLSEIAADTRAWMNPEAQWEERELAALYGATLMKLRPRCRQAFVAVREHGQSYAEAARTLGTSEKMIGKFITEAQRVFRAELRARGIRVPREKRSVKGRGREHRLHSSAAGHDAWPPPLHRRRRRTTRGPPNARRASELARRSFVHNSPPFDGRARSSRPSWRLEWATRVRIRPNPFERSDDLQTSDGLRTLSRASVVRAHGKTIVTPSD